MAYLRSNFIFVPKITGIEQLPGTVKIIVGGWVVYVSLGHSVDVGIEAGAILYVNIATLTFPPGCTMIGVTPAKSA